MAPAVGDVRGMRLFWGLELVRDRETKEPFVTRREKFEPNTLKRVSAAAMEMRVYVVNIIKTLILAPPDSHGEGDRRGHRGPGQGIGGLKQGGRITSEAREYHFKIIA